MYGSKSQAICEPQGRAATGAGWKAGRERPRERDAIQAFQENFVRRTEPALSLCPPPSLSSLTITSTMASSSSSAFASSSSSNTAQSCALCHDPLLITPHPDEEDEQLEPYLDDVLLHGACHAHWECLLDAYTQHPDPQQAKTMCAVCGKRGILDGEGRLLVDVRNEGGCVA